MPFSVQYGDVGGILSLGQRTGRGNLKARADELAQREDLAWAQLQEQTRQANARLGFAAQQAAIDNQNRRAYAAQQAASQQQQLAANLYNQEQARQAAVYQDQIDFQQQAALQQQQYDQQFAMGGIESMEEAARDSLAAIGQMDLDDEGRRLRQQWNNEFRSIVGERGVSLDEDAYAEVMGEFLAGIDSSGIERREIVEPTPEEWLAETTIETPYGLIGRDRSGMPRMLGQRPWTQEEADARWRTDPDGRRYFLDKDNKPFYPPKPEAEPVDRTTPRRSSYLDTYTAAHEMVMAESMRGHVEGDPIPAIDEADVRRRADEIMRREGASVPAGSVDEMRTRGEESGAFRPGLFGPATAASSVTIPSHAEAVIGGGGIDAGALAGIGDPGVHGGGGEPDVSGGGRTADDPIRFTSEATSRDVMMLVPPGGYFTDSSGAVSQHVVNREGRHGIRHPDGSVTPIE